jgi:4,5-dihydroxyphthalate decarboxylase
MTRRLSIVLGAHGQVADLRSGDVKVSGVDLDFVKVKRMPDAYRDMVRTQCYDISELAPTTYLMALETGAPLTALPIPMTRRFRHRGLLRRKSSALRQPKDIEGKRVGVRTHSVTAAVWTRGVLAEELGVDLGRVTWVTEEEENVTAYVPPANVVRVAEGQTLAGLAKAGELEAGFAGLAGIGAEAGDEWVDLVDDATAREKDWFARTHIYPLHGVIAVRNEVLRENPGLAAGLFDAFVEAKQRYWSRVTSGASAEAEDLRYRKLAELVGDPLPYGLEENLATFGALVRFAHRQGLIGKAPPVQSLFPDPRAPGLSPTAVWS